MNGESTGQTGLQAFTMSVFLLLWLRPAKQTQ
jgi:hypothetical protein